MEQQTNQPSQEQAAVTPKAKKNISGVNAADHQQFVTLAKALGIHHPQLFKHILSNYQNLPLVFDEVENSLMQQAKAFAPHTFEKRIKKMALRYAQAIIEAKNQPEVAVNLKLKNSAKSADARADALVAEIFTHNDNAINWYDKMLLTKSSIMDYATAKNKEDPEYYTIGKLVLNRCLERHSEQIEQHHKQHNLAPNHNVLAHYERLKTHKTGNE